MFNQCRSCLINTPVRRYLKNVPLPTFLKYVRPKLLREHIRKPEFLIDQRQATSTAMALCGRFMGNKIIRHSSALSSSPLPLLFRQKGPGLSSVDATLALPLTALACCLLLRHAPPLKLQFIVSNSLLGRCPLIHIIILVA